MKRFLAEYLQTALGVVLTLFGIDGFIGAVSMDAPIGILIFAFMGVMVGFHTLFVSLTGYPIPYSLDPEHEMRKQSTLKVTLQAMMGFFTFPTEIPKMIKFYQIGKHCGIYKEELYKREVALLQMYTPIQKNIIAGYVFNKLDNFSNGYLTEVAYRVDCIRRMPKVQYKEFVRFEEGFEFGDYKIELTFNREKEVYHVIRCSKCGSRVSVRDEVIATKLLTECKQHKIIPRL